MATLANAGTAMMWTPLLHLSIGNVVIAFVEAVLVWAVIGRGPLRCFGMMLLANYASAALGLFLRSRFNDLVTPLFGEPDIFNANARLVAFAVAAFWLTLVVEAPFTIWLAKRSDRALWHGVFALLLANVVSYAGLAAAYSRSSADTLLTTLTPVLKAAVHEGDSAYEVWYIDAQTQDVRAVGLDGLLRRVVSAQVFPSAEYLAVVTRATIDDPTVVASSLKTNTTTRIGSLAKGDIFTTDDDREIGWYGYLDARRFPGLRESVKIWVGEWAGRDTYLWDERPPRRELLQIAHENALDNWRIAYVTVLPDTRLVFQLGPEQICVADPDKKTLALIARGRGPIVVRRSNPD